MTYVRPANIFRPIYGYSIAAGDISESLQDFVYSRRCSNKSSIPDASTSVEGSKSIAMNEPAPVQKPGSATSRCRLHIRQQPRAARAGPDGKDRRYVLLYPPFPFRFNKSQGRLTLLQFSNCTCKTSIRIQNKTWQNYPAHSGWCIAN